MKHDATEKLLKKIDRLETKVRFMSDEITGFKLERTKLVTKSKAELLKAIQGLRKQNRELKRKLQIATTMVLPKAVAPVLLRKPLKPNGNRKHRRTISERLRRMYPQHHQTEETRS